MSYLNESGIVLSYPIYVQHGTGLMMIMAIEVFKHLEWHGYHVTGIHFEGKTHLPVAEIVTERAE